ncbi:MAG: leucine-rich repeat domain-containing protein [Oscillospiraceae bacterium]|nr:leucine-rich repeat domain-containing protein [Oscillospiraceae bacterium]
MRNLKIIKKIFLLGIFLRVVLFSLSGSILASAAREDDDYNIKSDFNCVMEFVVYPELGKAKIGKIINKEEARGRLILPDTVFFMGEELDIIEVGVGAFQDCKDLTEVIIPGSIKTLSYNAFSGCVSLKKLVLEEGLENICMWALEGCKNLKYIDIPSSVVRIDSRAFLNSGLDNVKLPTETKEGFIKEWYYIDKNKTIKTSNNIDKDEINDLLGKDIVSEVYCDKINNIKYNLQQDEAVVVGCDETVKKEINIPDKIKINNTKYDVTRVLDYAFLGCSSLEKIKFNNIISIGKWAFLGCENLQEIEFCESLTEIKEQAFADCVKLKSVIVPESVRCIENGVFAGCQNLKSVILKEGIESIGIMTFRDCCSLEELEIPSSLRTIYKHAFLDCNNLKKLKMPANKEYLCRSGDIFESEVLETLQNDDVYIINKYESPFESF